MSMFISLSLSYLSNNSLVLAVQALIRFTFKSKCFPIIIQIRNLLQKCIVANLSVTFVWIPSHCGILGNEKADALAKDAAFSDVFPYMNYCHDFPCLAKDLLQQDWSKDWARTSLKKGVQYRLIQPEIQFRPWFFKIKLSKSATSSLSMNKDICLLCFADNSRVVYVKNLRLHNVYEGLSNVMTQSGSQRLCFICYKRLLLCEQVVKQIHELSTEQHQSQEIPLVRLSAKKDYTEIPPEDRPKLFGPDNETKEYIRAEDVEIVLENIAEEQAANAAVAQHIRKRQITNDEDKPYSCDVCTKKFITNGNLNRHKKTHMTVKPFSCDICNKQFNANCNLKRHRRTHFDDKPYGCHMCSKSFFEKGDLERHIKFHTGEKPYACNMCSKKFIRKGLLDEHKQVHSGVKSYACDLCDTKLSTISTLKAHKRQHAAVKPMPCDVCNKIFFTKANLEGHKKIHTDNRCFSCDVCNKKVTSKRNLRRHKLTHIGLKPYNCDLCGGRFSDSSCLVRHRKKMHADDTSIS